MSREPCETAVLTTSRSNLQGSCAWGEKRSCAFCSASLSGQRPSATSFSSLRSALLHVGACSRASSVLLTQNTLRVCQKRPRVCQKNHAKAPYWPWVVAIYKAAVLETENDLLWFVLHRYLLFGMFAPVARDLSFLMSKKTYNMSKET